MLTERHWLRTRSSNSSPWSRWVEVTEEKFARAERSEGFHPKPGLGPCATAGFGGSRMNTQGRVTNDKMNLDLYTELDPEFLKDMADSQGPESLTESAQSSDGPYGSEGSLEMDTLAAEIKNVVDFKELIKVLWKSEGLQDSEKSYTFSELCLIVADVGRGKMSLDSVTSTAGLRDKVEELLSQGLSVYSPEA